MVWLIAPSSTLARFSYRFYSFNSKFTVQLCAICRAFLCILRQIRQRYLLYSDSLSALQSVLSCRPDYPKPCRPSRQLGCCTRNPGVEVIFCMQLYLPGRVNGSQHRTRNCGQWRHPWRCDSSPSAPSGDKRPYLHAFGLGTLAWNVLLVTRWSGVSLYTPWSIPCRFICICTHRDEDLRTFLLKGLLCDILGYVRG
jgi:hypothetical protein